MILLRGFNKITAHNFFRLAPVSAYLQHSWLSFTAAGLPLSRKWHFVKYQASEGFYISRKNSVKLYTQTQKIMFHSDIIQWMVSLPLLLNAKGWTITADASAWRIIPNVNLKSQYNSNPGAHVHCSQEGLHFQTCIFKWKKQSSSFLSCSIDLNELYS